MSEKHAPTTIGQKPVADAAPAGRDVDDDDGNDSASDVAIPQKNADDDRWEACSLQSTDAREEEVLDEVEHLPIPGRESHTSDIDQFELYLKRIRSMERSSLDTPFNEKFWEFFRNLLKQASDPVGYGGVVDPKTTEAKGPADNEKFISKIQATSHINPIHPILLSQASEVPPKEVLTELLYATKARLLTMKLTPNCLRCGSSVCAIERATIKNLPKVAYCEGCQYKNHVECLQKIKVVFVVHPDVLYVLAENFACQPSKASMAANQLFAAVPATFSGSGFRYNLGCGGDDTMMGPALAKGRYRMHCPVSKTDNYLMVENDASEEDEPVTLPLHVSDIVCKRPGDERKTLRVKHGKIHIDVWTDTNSFFVLWIQNDLDDRTLLYLPEEERKPYTNVQELLNHPTYQILFGKDTATTLSKAVKRMNSQVQKGPATKKRRRPLRSMPA
eukprot:CAMPEP_0194063152 /NCGR_PEP_ID=MMETSP0009_2-20130614/79583_1 /TAXON_ID=210454 /ORGANISM="Grammatophora oceanica, Strain CCMP 410" /LENGTH=445 /DNA_ID=CAMNT_0038715171 /DNA_START=87 /DNA_END=1424 /DNA_ORIENTATION=-